MEPGMPRDDSLLTAAQKQFGDLTTDSQKSAMDAELALTESRDAEAATEAAYRPERSRSETELAKNETSARCGA